MLTTADNLVATGVRANFVRAKVIAISGGTGVTVQILGWDCGGMCCDPHER
jgi:hypothetical protein